METTSVNYSDADLGHLPYPSGEPTACLLEKVYFDTPPPSPIPSALALSRGARGGGSLLEGGKSAARSKVTLAVFWYTN